MSLLEQPGPMFLKCVGESQESAREPSEGPQSRDGDYAFEESPVHRQAEVAADRRVFGIVFILMW